MYWFLELAQKIPHRSEPMTIRNVPTAASLTYPSSKFETYPSSNASPPTLPAVGGECITAQCTYSSRLKKINALLSAWPSLPCHQGHVMSLQSVTRVPAWWCPEWRKYGVTCRTPCRWARADSVHLVVGRAPGASSLVVVQGASPPVVVQTPHFCTRSPPPAVQTDQDPRQVTLTEPCCKSLSPSPPSFISSCERLSRLNESELLLCQHEICTLEWYSPSWEQHFWRQHIDNYLLTVDLRKERTFGLIKSLL